MGEVRECEKNLLVVEKKKERKQKRKQRVRQREDISVDLRRSDGK